MENITSSSQGEALETGPKEIPRQFFTRQTLFSCLKSRGFNFEDTHVTKPERIAKLIALLAIGFCWAYKAGQWLHKQKPIKIMKHGRKAISFFRYGLDLIRDVALNARQSCSTGLQTVAGFLDFNSMSKGVT
ncbi:putative Transposase (IS4 family) [Legionella maceachernii]|uniref:Putative Transposase (IS4 family) n=1 Tax=Legionella maceachernii TaxID=466 RepID=A0A0W0W4Z5_9GAMM|nr:putative Transposase (IS4 family) [Legionella maceachernii]SKA27148.1 hypothetical protein SAMN02745128_02943 [Legionella maceachernii]SUP04578.1 Uncharacterised protein [Legionella maceachernii]